jgi:hypothetical protein
VTARSRRDAVTAGVGLGLAAGFAVWVWLVPLAGVGYHSGDTGTAADPMRVAAARAGALWVACALAGAPAGGATAVLALRAGASARLLAQAATAALGVYALALRGAWGDAAAASLPVGGAVVPALAALAVAGALAAALRGRPPAGGAPRGLAALHLCCSLAAAHLTVQLAYYAGLGGAFGRGLAAALAVLAGR